MRPLHARNRGRLALAVGLTAWACLPIAPALSEESREVTLRMKGGGFQVTGEIRAFDGTRYIVETAQFGKLTLQATRFDCVGAACTTPLTAAAWTYEPLSPDRHETVTIRGTELIGQQLMPALVRGYAASAGLTVTQVAGTDPNEMRLKLVDARGKELAVVAMAKDDTVAGLGALERNDASIAMTDRVATKEEAEALAAAGPKIKTAQNEHLIGTDGIAIIVSPDNPVTSLSIDILAKIFSGQITDWYELGLPPGKIRIVARDGAADAADRFYSVALKPRGVKWTDAIERITGEAELADTVTRDRNAIGLVSFAFQRSAKLVPIESTCGLIQRPTPFALKTGEYPFGRRLYLYAIAPPKQAAARGLLRCAVSPEAPALRSRAALSIPFRSPISRSAWRTRSMHRAKPSTSDRCAPCFPTSREHAGFRSPSAFCPVLWISTARHKSK